MSLIDAVRAAAAGRGYATRDVHADEPSRVDVLLAIGLPTYYETFLRRRSGTARAIAWFGEPLPRAAPSRAPFTRALRRAGAGVLRRSHRSLRFARSIPLPTPLARARAAAYIERERQGNLEVVRRIAASVDDVVTTSHDRREVLAGHGIDARVVPFGYHEAFAGRIVSPGVERDLDVVSIGSGLQWPSRRARGTETVLRSLGPAVAVASPPRLWGADRHALLSRTRIVLDVHRIPGNFVGLRLLIALAAGAVLVTEPLDDPRPFQSGVHYLESPLARLPATIRDVLGDEAGRRRIVEAGQSLICGDLTMERSLAAVLG